jgi:hypothetical protein
VLLVELPVPVQPARQHGAGSLAHDLGSLNEA